MRLVWMRRIVCESVLRILSLVKQQVCKVLSAEMKLRILVCSSWLCKSTWPILGFSSICLQKVYLVNLLHKKKGNAKSSLECLLSYHAFLPFKLTILAAFFSIFADNSPMMIIMTNLLMITWLLLIRRLVSLHHLLQSFAEITQKWVIVQALKLIIRICSFDNIFKSVESLRFSNSTPSNT